MNTLLLSVERLLPATVTEESDDCFSNIGDVYSVQVRDHASSQRASHLVVRCKYLVLLRVALRIGKGPVHRIGDVVDLCHRNLLVLGLLPKLLARHHDRDGTLSHKIVREGAKDHAANLVSKTVYPFYLVGCFNSPLQRTLSAAAHDNKSRTDYINDLQDLMLRVLAVKNFNDHTDLKPSLPE